MKHKRIRHIHAEPDEWIRVHREPPTVPPAPDAGWDVWGIVMTLAVLLVLAILFMQFVWPVLVFLGRFWPFWVYVAFFWLFAGFLAGP